MNHARLGTLLVIGILWPRPGSSQTVPAHAPDSVPAWLFNDTNIVLPRGRSERLIKDVILVRFHPAATQAERQAAIDAVSGRVIGGGRIHGVDEYYIVLLPRDTTHTKLFAALDVIRPMRAVQGVLPDYVEHLDNTPIPSPWPVLTDHLPDLDVSRVVMTPPDTFKWFRTDISLHFKSTVSDSAKAAFFKRHQMTVIGVTTAGRFFVRIPDPGNTVDALFRAVDAIRHEPEVAIAGAVARSQLREVY